MGDFFKEYADLASWLGLLISTAGMLLTIWTLVTAQGIKAKLMRRFQLPQMIKDLHEGVTDLTGIVYAPDFDARSLKAFISRLSVTLDNAHRKTKGAKVADAKKRAEELLKFQILTKEIGMDFILKMTRAHEELRLEKRDDPWNI